MPSRSRLGYLGSSVLLLLALACARASAPDSAAGPHPTVSWVLACRVGQGGFGCYPGDSAFTSRTGMALEALQTLGALEGLTGRDSLVTWLRARQQSDGGFFESANYFLGKTMPWGGTSAIEPTYWAVHALKLLGAQPLDPESAASFLRARQHAGGGYDAWEYCFGAAPEAVFTTYWAVAALRDLGQPLPDSAATINYVRSLQNTLARRGGFSLEADDWFYSGVAGSGFALQALEILGGAPERPAEVRRFLFSGYGQEPDGGFEVGHEHLWGQDYFSRTEDTWAAVQTLKLLGTPLSDSDHSRAMLPRSDCIRWLGSVQNPDGGFGRFGANPNRFPVCPSEMRATWQAVRTLELLGAQVPAPAHPMSPVNELQVHRPAYPHPCLNSNDPAEVWAFRRIALPVYEHFYNLTGSRLKALGMLNRWANLAVGPHNGAWITQGRGILMHGWGQCGTMSWLLQQMATSIDIPARGSFIIADVNCEMLIKEDAWDKAHWCLFVPFTNEFPNPNMATPEDEKNGWSVLDMAANYTLMKKDPARLAPTWDIENHLFKAVKIATIDTLTGDWGPEIPLDSTSTYGSPAADSLYPGGSW